MIDQCVAAYTFSKSYSMSGWRLGFAVAVAASRRGDRQDDQHVALVHPAVRAAGRAGRAGARRRRARRRHGRSSSRRSSCWSTELQTGRRRDGADAGRRRSTSSRTSRPICNRLGITSHGLALYLLEGADDEFGVACLGGECFGAAGRGFLRFSCAEPDERLIVQAVEFWQGSGDADRAGEGVSGGA